ncbi:MAG: iron complex transport system substrate-binding protein [Rhodobacteraceae bacterium HLUCCO07]|nr:MAG: iron complex transport system substrate-binding protein [Rhodobacteraceae bacterium HLUCCO07]
MTRVHPFFWAQAALCLAVSLFLIGTARADAPQRIVSVGGAITEIVYALGEEDRLVARDTTSNYPEAALDLPDVGYIRRLSPEGILSVDPDLILAQEGAGPPEALEILHEAAIPLVEIPEGFTASAVTTKITAVAEALGVPEKGAELAARINDDLDAVQTETSSTAGKSVLFILSMEGGRVLAGGQNTAADAIIALAGGQNAATGFEGYKPLTDEAIIESGAEIILMMDRTGDMDVTDEQLFTHPAIAATPAGQARAVIRMDGMAMLGFSVRTAEAATALSQALTQVGG